MASLPPPSQAAQAAPLICPGHSRPVVSIEFSECIADGIFLISGCHDKTAQLRNGETGDWIGTFEGHKGAVWGAALDAPVQRAITCSADFSAKVWDATTGDELHTFQHRHIVRTADWAPDSSRFITGGKEAKLRVFDMASPSADPQLISGHDKMIKVVKYLDTNTFLSAGEDTTLRVWDLRSGSATQQLQFGGPVNSVEILADGTTATIAAGNEVSFWDLPSWQCVKRHNLSVIEGNGYGVNSASIHPEKVRFVAGGGNFWVYEYDYETGEELVCNKGHHGPVYGVRYMPDGRAYASAGDDGTIRFWGMAVDAEEDVGQSSVTESSK